MAVMKKIAGLVAGASAVAVMGIAVAQGIPPNPFVGNPALGAGQQSTHITSMGETGVPGFVDQVQTAQVVTVEEVAVAPAPAPAPAPAQEAQQMGAAEVVIIEEPAPQMVAKADRG